MDDMTYLWPWDIRIVQLRWRSKNFWSAKVLGCRIYIYIYFMHNRIFFIIKEEFARDQSWYDKAVRFSIAFWIFENCQIGKLTYFVTTIQEFYSFKTHKSVVLSLSHTSFIIFALSDFNVKCMYLLMMGVCILESSKIYLSENVLHRPCSSVYCKIEVPSA